MAKYADIIVDISHEKLDRTFQYRIPETMEDEIAAGSAVIVPFGRGSREIKGYVTGLSDMPSCDESKIKNIIKIDRDTVSPENSLVMTAAWMKRNYGGTMIQSLKTVIPVKDIQKVLKKKIITLLIDQDAALARSAYFSSKHQLAKARTLDALSEEPVLPYELLSRKRTFRLLRSKALIRTLLSVSLSRSIFVIR